MRIEATFTGPAPSMGYKPGKQYILHISRSDIVFEDRAGISPYGSVEAFLKNWTNITVIEK